MFNYQLKDISAITVLDTRRKLSNGLFRIRVRVIYNRKTREYSTGKSLSKKEWETLASNGWKTPLLDEWKEVSSLSIADIKKTLNDIKSTFDIIENHIRDLTNNESFSFEALNTKLQKPKLTQTVNDYFKQKIDDLKNEDREGSRLYYDNVLKGIERYKGNSILFASINPKWLKGYELFLINEGKTYTSVGMHMRAIRAIMNIGKQKGIINESKYPFGRSRYEIPTGESRKMALTIKQIGEIVNFSDGNPKTDFYRDIWFFSYLCGGINFADICRLKYSNISNNEISWIREKTKNTQKHKKYIRAYLTNEMEAIIKKWGNEPNPDSFIFPFFEKDLTAVQQKHITKSIISSVNQRMKYIGEKLEIGKISTYTARHSYATVLKRAGSNIAFISESLGHSDLKTTENYLDSFEQSERAKNSALLTSFKSEGVK